MPTKFVVATLAALGTVIFVGAASVDSRVTLPGTPLSIEVPTGFVVDLDVRTTIEKGPSLSFGRRPCEGCALKDEPKLIIQRMDGSFKPKSLSAFVERTLRTEGVVAIEGPRNIVVAGKPAVELVQRDDVPELGDLQGIVHLIAIEHEQDFYLCALWCDDDTYSTDRRSFRSFCESIRFAALR